METELPYNHSTTEFTGYLHWTDTSTESTGVKQSFKWTNVEIARLIHIILRPMLIIIGTTGNYLTFYIVRRTSLKSVSNCFYMSLLALADRSKFL